MLNFIFLKASLYSRWVILFSKILAFWRVQWSVTHCFWSQDPVSVPEALCEVEDRETNASSSCNNDNYDSNKSEFSLNIDLWILTPTLFPNSQWLHKFWSCFKSLSIRIVEKIHSKMINLNLMNKLISRSRPCLRPLCPLWPAPPGGPRRHRVRDPVLVPHRGRQTRQR